MKQKLNLMENKTTEISKNKSFIFACISTLCFTESLEMNHFPCTEKTDRISNFRDIAYYTENVVIGSTGFLFCCKVFKKISKRIALALEMCIRDSLGVARQSTAGYETIHKRNVKNHSPKKPESCFEIRLFWNRTNYNKNKIYGGKL